LPPQVWTGLKTSLRALGEQPEELAREARWTSIFPLQGEGNVSKKEPVIEKAQGRRVRDWPSRALLEEPKCPEV
jgi:hypothetical protein